MLNAIDRDLGNIKLKRDETQLHDVTVTATVPQFELKGEKKIFNVDVIYNNKKKIQYDMCFGQ